MLSWEAANAGVALSGRHCASDALRSSRPRVHADGAGDRKAAAATATTAMAMRPPAGGEGWRAAASGSVWQRASVFELEPPRGRITLRDVRDAVEACSKCDSIDSRKSCFIVFGLDAERVQEYNEVVESLEHSLASVDAPERADGIEGWRSWLTRIRRGNN